MYLDIQLYPHTTAPPCNYDRGIIPVICAAPSTGLTQLTRSVAYSSASGLYWFSTSMTSKIPARTTVISSGTPWDAIFCPYSGVPSVIVSILHLQFLE